MPKIMKIWSGINGESDVTDYTKSLTIHRASDKATCGGCSSVVVYNTRLQKKSCITDSVEKVVFL